MGLMQVRLDEENELVILNIPVLLTETSLALVFRNLEGGIEGIIAGNVSNRDYVIAHTAFDYDESGGLEDHLVVKTDSSIKNFDSLEVWFAPHINNLDRKRKLLCGVQRSIKFNQNRDIEFVPQGDLMLFNDLIEKDDLSYDKKLHVHGKKIPFLLEEIILFSKKSNRLQYLVKDSVRSKRIRTMTYIKDNYYPSFADLKGVLR